MRKFYLILLSLCTVCCFGQNQITGYTFWYNNDYASRTTQAIVPQQQAELSFQAETSGLSEGLNIFHFQVFDQNDVYSSPISKFFYKTKGAPSDTNRIAAYRYWFNNDMAQSDTVYITAAKQADILTEIDANALNDGLNSIHIQVMDQQEIWSSVLSQYFLKSNTHYINAYQYWFNSDIASAVTVSVFPSKIVLINDAIDASALNEGMNIMHLRFRDEQNLWSSTISQFFFKTQTGGSDTAKICSYQYWFDNDFAGAVTENITAVAHAHISAALPTNLLNNGIHVVHIRFKQENGLWSSPLSSYFFKMPESNAAQNLITEYQYWFNNDFNQAVHYVLPQAMAQHELLLNIDMTQMPKGNYVLNLRTKDTLGLWSSVIADAFTKNPFPISAFTADITEFCDSGYVQFTNNSIDGDVYLWDFGDGTTSDDFEPQHFFAASGQYNVSLTVTDIATQLDSTTSVTITVHPWYHFNDTVNICNGDEFLWHDQSYNQTGVYYDSLTSLYGCDSIYILHLTVQPHYQFVSHDTICNEDSYLWRGQNYTAQGTYYDSLTTAYGCDSVYILHLTVHPTYVFSETSFICQNDTYSWRGQSYSIQGIYYDSLLTVNGCDSVYVLNLTVNPIYEYSQSDVICQGDVFTWHGNSYTVQGTYYDSLQTVNGCDSVYILNLTVNPTYEYSQSGVICQGDVFTWRGNSYSLQGTYYDSLQTVDGCDSVYILNLSANPTYEYSQSEVICQGDIFTWHGNTYTTQGTYYDSLHTVNGCDSIYTLHLTINPTYEFSENVEICLGDTFYWRGQNYYATGTYNDAFLSQHGCDSNYVLNLLVNPMYFFMDAVSMCDGESIIWHGNSYTHAGIYYDSLQTINGCDSVFSLNLSVFPSFYYTELDTICEGDTYFWRGNYYTTAGTYFDYHNTQNNCDSIYSLELFIRNLPNVSIDNIDSLYCIYHAPVPLTAIPTGGVFTGQGVSGSVFSPAAAGIGTWTITYAYTDIFGCFNADTLWVVVDACVGISERQTNPLKLYPNPNNGRFFIEIQEHTQIFFYNALGSLIYNNTFEEGIHELQFTQLPVGVYFLKAEGKNTSELVRVVVWR